MEIWLNHYLTLFFLLYLTAFLCLSRLSFGNQKYFRNITMNPLCPSSHPLRKEMLAVSMVVLKCVLCQLLFSLLTKHLTEMNLGKLAFICSHMFKMQSIMIVEETGKMWQVTSHVAHTAAKQIQTMQAFRSLTPFLYSSEPQLHMSQGHPHSVCLSPLQLTSSENNLTSNEKCISIVILNSVTVTLKINNHKLNS